MAGDRAEILEQSFSRQAAAFEDRRFNGAFTEDVDWLFARLKLHPDQLVLDVAAGTGHAGRRLAPAVGCVVALDATPAMLEVGRRAADAAGLGNIVFQRGDAKALPFLDGSFDVVVCRFAVHHFDEPRVQIAEMGRCVRRGGAVVIADLAADEDPGAAATQNRLERLRDPSHARILPIAELTRVIERSGMRILAINTRAVERTLPPWLAQTGAGEDVVAEIRAALRNELDGGRPTGFRPRAAGDEICFTQRFVSVTAERP
ncbi:MAG TPA: methyltransferase domain-containing protein [Solirubrobacteraceae bacterium]|jgi:ubiquinone/menaquinone biosynthesis C-methylase UbiE|nr:methyltransferase domain-containing protein [Solirubrobacteraceae bacterium]